MAIRILVIDDSAGILHAIESALGKKGYEVASALNGERAFEAINEQRPDLIVSDLEMPQMDGFAFYKALKSNPLISDIPVIIMTEREKTEDAFWAVGVDGFIVKPFHPEDLVAEIQGILGIDESGQPIETAGKDRPRKKIFAVGASGFILEQMARHAEKAGYTIVTSESPGNAVDAAIKFQPDIIFVDVQLRSVSPCQLVYDLHQASRIRETPIIGYCYYPLDKLGDIKIRQEILGIHETSRDILQCGAAGYMGRYHRPLFICTIKKYLEDGNGYGREIIYPLYGNQSMNKLKELLSILDKGERHKALAGYAKSLKADPLEAADHLGEYNEEKLAILISDAYHRRQKVNIFNLSFFVIGILVGVGLMASFHILPGVTTGPEEGGMLSFGGQVSSGDAGDESPDLSWDLSDSQDAIYAEYDNDGTLLREYYYKDGELVVKDKDKEEEDMIITTTFSEE